MTNQTITLPRAELAAYQKAIASAKTQIAQLERERDGAQQRERLLQAQYDDARKVTAEFDRLRLLACQEVERLAPLARASDRRQVDNMFLHAELAGLKEREAELHARVREWEECYDALAGAFYLYMDILECKQALSDYAGVYYDILIGDLAGENAALHAEIAQLKEGQP